MIEAIKLVSQLGKTFLKGRIAKSEAKAKSAADWEAIAQQNAGNSWKDEWLTILFSLPLVMCFIPSAVPYVKNGFAALQEMPTWYQYMLSVIVAASFGVRSAVGIMNRKK
tara:strand:+ start:5334 stop:5663 length:330 start_codon:yes stop_codon:yes gene_type:complete